MAVLGSSLFISHPGTCSWVSSDATLAFNDTFLYDWPIWKFRYVIHYTLYTNDAATNFFFSCSNDSINTGYADVSSSEHSVVTSVTRFNIAIHSVSQ